MNTPEQTLLYGTSWCEKTSALREFLDLQNVSYRYHDVDEDAEAEEKIKKIGEGKVQIPVVFIKNSILKNPSIAFLDQKLTEHGLLDPL